MYTGMDELQVRSLKYDQENLSSMNSVRAYKLLLINLLNKEQNTIALLDCVYKSFILYCISFALPCFFSQIIPVVYL